MSSASKVGNYKVILLLTFPPIYQAIRPLTKLFNKILECGSKLYRKCQAVRGKQMAEEAILKAV